MRLILDKSGDYNGKIADSGSFGYKFGSMGHDSSGTFY